jgi:hypothetical protein
MASDFSVEKRGVYSKVLELNLVMLLPTQNCSSLSLSVSGMRCMTVARVPQAHLVQTPKAPGKPE